MAEQEWPDSIRGKFPMLSLRHVLLLQAHIRGFIVRSHMKRVRDEFLEVFNEIQEDDHLCIFWKSQFLCLPSYTIAEEKSKCSALQTVQKSDGAREITAVESNFAITEENPQIPCSPCDKVFDDDRPSPASTQSPVKTSDEPVVEDKESTSQDLFFDDKKPEKEDSPPEFENRDRIHQLPMSNECFERPTTVEQDIESVKAFVSSDESQQKSSNSTSNKQEHHQALPANKVCIPKDKVVHSLDLSNDGKNIDSTNSSLCFKPFEKDNKSGFQNLDSSFTDVTSVWGSDLSLSPSGDSRSETPCHETVASLVLQRQNIALELVWLQQAILSRKNYLRLKSQLDSS